MEIVNENPSLGGMISGYAAEVKLRGILTSIEEVTDLGKPDDHDRFAKGDRIILYKGQLFKIESKSLQSNSVYRDSDGIKGKVQVDASDKREVTFPDGSKLQTTCLLADEFDILSINLFAFGGGWKFAFVRNSDLPKSTYRKYTPYQRSHLLATSVSVSLPLPDRYYDDPQALLDEMVIERLAKS